ncbi:hypothetical protein QC762_0041580 [Podospora pseudocomata]|uniref:chitinase n=1 Tax=Podospora pseudocomata TaxID=2093779 RepID=A0ABR0GMP7_9PEZI|nr:hypothetical protein QC762_0041580 [Podospora pseudocomata]
MKVINNASPPSEFKRIGYFEAWRSANKKERPCLFMDATQIPTGYTLVHFAFGEVSSSFAVGVSKLKNQFDKFVKMRGFKRIIAFCVKPGNREILATNIAKFVVDPDLDGVDLDWEYPGAPDLPSADPLNGLAYLELLKLLRQKLPWTTFPIGEISKVVDYIVYMTYDLHGQWDFDSPWSSPGCPAGNCLRSHISRKETLNALSMVTKTGVSSTKLMIGITSYGRSFRMVDPSCTGPMCTFTGALSGAKLGRCTRTAGYLANAEIQEILHYDKSSRTYYDEGIMSDILVYGSDWVADMNNDNKGRREALWKSMNFGGVSDWAIGLAEFLPNDVSQVPSLSMEEIKEDWANITCKHAYARNSSYRELDRWKTLKADEAWKHVVVECSDESERRPTAALLLSSFVKLAGIYYELYDGIQAAQLSLITTLSKFSSTFAPEQKADESLTMTLNILSAGFGVLAGPDFAKAFSSGNFFSQNPGIGEKLESAVMKGVENEPVTEDLASQFNWIVMSWKEIVDITQRQAFSETKDGVCYLSSMMSNGKLLKVEPMNRFDTESAMVKVLYAFLIPHVWHLRAYSPVLIHAEWDCQKVGVDKYCCVEGNFLPFSDSLMGCRNNKWHPTLFAVHVIFSII